jgi:hypothetical protein
MKRTILVLALTLLLSAGVPAQAANDPADVQVPAPNRLISSGDQGNENSPTPQLYIEDVAAVNMRCFIEN